MKNLQVVANRIWETPVEDPLELPNQPELYEIFLAPLTSHLSPACMLADFGPAPQLLDEDWKRPDRVQHFYARFRTTTTLCFDFAARVGKDAGALGMLSACLARMGEFVKWRDSAIRWSRTPEAALAEDVVMHNLKRLSDQIWTTPFEEEILYPTQGEIVKCDPLVVTSVKDPGYDRVPLPLANSRHSPFVPGMRHEAHAAHAQSSNSRHPRAQLHSPTPHHDYASDTSANPLREGPENCEPGEEFNFINTSTVPRAFFDQHVGPTQPPVVLRSQQDLDNGGRRR